MSLSRAAPAGLVVLTGILGGVLAGVEPSLVGVAAAGAAVGIVCLVFGARSLVWLTIFLTFTVAPAALPTSVAVGGAVVHAWEITLAAAFVVALPIPTRAQPWFAVAATWVLGWTALGVTNGSDIVGLVKDLRPIAEGGLAFAVGASILARGQTQSALRTIRLSLWVSAGATLLGVAGVWTLTADVESANLFNQTQSSATRILSNATFLAVAVLCTTLAAAGLGRVRLRAALPYLVPAAVLVVLAFSRNHLVALTVALLVAAILDLTAQNWLRLTASGILTLMALGAIAATATSLFPNSGVAAVVESYQNRVVDGLSSSTRSTDPSVLYRLREDQRLTDAFAEKPVLGHGFGYAYQPPQGPPGTFGGDVAPYYAHNFYLWLLVKTGVVGAAVWAVAYVAPMLGVLVRRRREAFWLAVPLAGLLASSVFAPLPIGEADSVLVGLLAGGLILAPHIQPASQVERAADQHHRAAVQ